MKTWIKTNLSKITLALALTGLIIGSLAHNKTNNLTYFLNHDHIAVWGNTTIWSWIWGGVLIYIFLLIKQVIMI